MWRPPWSAPKPPPELPVRRELLIDTLPRPFPIPRPVLSLIVESSTVSVEPKKVF